MTTKLIQYKCPICNLNSTARIFKEREYIEPLDLGYVIIRDCMGKKGFPEVSREPLVNCLDTLEGAEILDRMKHMILGVIHALYKQKLVSDEELPITSPKTDEDKDLIYKYENLKKLFDELVMQNNNLKQGVEDVKDVKNNSVDSGDKYIKQIKKLQDYNSELVMQFNNLQQENQELQETIEQLQEDPQIEIQRENTGYGSVY